MNYLSIDLDFFQRNGDFYRVFSRPCFTQDCKIVTNHEQLLFDMKDMSCSEHHNLYNIDFHSDIVYFGSSERTQAIKLAKYMKEFKGSKHYAKCSTWVNSVPYQKTSNYFWIHPKHIGIAGNCWSEDADNPYKHGSVWKSLHKTDDLEIIPWNNIDKIGICVSPEWIDWDFIDFSLILHWNKRNYLKLNRIYKRVLMKGTDNAQFSNSSDFGFSFAD